MSRMSLRRHAPYSYMPCCPRFNVPTWGEKKSLQLVCIAHPELTAHGEGLVWSSHEDMCPEKKIVIQSSASIVFLNDCLIYDTNKSLSTSHSSVLERTSTRVFCPKKKHTDYRNQKIHVFYNKVAHEFWQPSTQKESQQTKGNPCVFSMSSTRKYCKEKNMCFSKK